MSRELFGIVPKRAITLAVARRSALPVGTARHVVTLDPVAIQEDATALDLPGLPAASRRRRLPVVDDV